MGLDFNTAYRVMVHDDKLTETYFLGVAVGARPFRGHLPDYLGGRLADGYEWIPNSPIWRSRREFLRVESDEGGKLVATSIPAEAQNTRLTYTFEPITLSLLEEVREDVSGYENLIANMTSDADIQNFYLQAWLRDDWREYGDIREDMSLTEREAAEVGEIRFWKSRGWVQKTDAGSWVDIDGPEGHETAPSGTVRQIRQSMFQRRGDEWHPVAPGPRGELAGEWKPTAEGLPENSREHHWDDSRDSYTLERQELHQHIINRILDHISPVDTSINTKHAVITMGVPASGKSEAVQNTMNTANYAHVDPDKIREQLPEFKAAVDQRAKNGGSIVADETINISDRAVGSAIDKGTNLLLEGVVASPEWYEKQLFPLLRKRGYKITLMLVHEPDVEAAVWRAEDRGKKSGRFVPERHIRSAHPKIPASFMQLAKQVDGFTAYQTGRPPLKMWGRDEGREIVYDKESYDAFLKFTKTEWWEVLLGSELLEKRIKPTEIEWEDFLKRMEQAWEAEEAAFDAMPERYTDGVEIPIVSVDDVKKGNTI